MGGIWGWGGVVEGVGTPNQNDITHYISNTINQAHYNIVMISCTYICGRVWVHIPLVGALLRINFVVDSLYLYINGNDIS